MNILYLCFTSQETLAIFIGALTEAKGLIISLKTSQNALPLFEMPKE